MWGTVRKPQGYNPHPTPLPLGLAVHCVQPCRGRGAPRGKFSAGYPSQRARCLSPTACELIGGHHMHDVTCKHGMTGRPMQGNGRVHRTSDRQREESECHWSPQERFDKEFTRERTRLASRSWLGNGQQENAGGAAHTTTYRTAGRKLVCRRP